MSKKAYAALTLNTTTMGTITGEFGRTATSAQLQHVFGPNWLQTFLQYQVTSESCVYYLDSDPPQNQAFQLCFNGSNVLVNKQVIPVPATPGS